MLVLGLVLAARQVTPIFAAERTERASVELSAGRFRQANMQRHTAHRWKRLCDRS